MPGAGTRCGRWAPTTSASAISAAGINELIEQAVLAVFATITTGRSSTNQADTGKVAELQEQLSVDREALERLDDDHYDRIIDRATWLRQRSRLVDRITARQHDYQQTLPARPVVTIDVATVRG